MKFSPNYPLIVIRHPTLKGYSIAFIGDTRPTWMLKGYCMWFKYKRDAQKKTHILN